MKRLLIIALAIGLVSCNKMKEDESKVIKKDPVVSLETIEPGSIDERIYLSGDVVASNSVDIYPDVAGKVSKIIPQEGDYIKKNVTVAEIDRNKPGMNFAPSPVLSPISGTITQVYTNIGSIAAPSMPLFKIGTLDRLEIKTNVSEKDLGRIKVGQLATVTTDSYPGEEFSAVVRELNPVVNPVTRTLGVTLELTGETILKPGMFVDLEIVVKESRDTVVVNRDIVVSRNGKNYIWKHNDSKVSLVEIETGIEKDNSLEVVSGLNFGDSVVIQGFTYLEDGISVRTLDMEAK